MESNSTEAGNLKPGVIASGGHQPSQTQLTTFMDLSLDEAAAKGDITAFRDKAAHLDLIVTPNKNTILHIHITAQCGDTKSTQFVEAVLQMCPSLFQQANAKGETLLHIAAKYGNRETLKFLIEYIKALHGNDLERGSEAIKQMLRRTNKEKDIALHEAVRFRHLAVMRLLVNEDLESALLMNDAGETPFFLAVERQIYMEDLETCESLTHDGPNGRTTLHVPVIGKFSGLMGKILEVTGSTLTKKVDLQGWTPLHHAAYVGDLWMVGELLKRDASAAYIADIDGKRTALHLAASFGRKDVLKELISRCPDCCELADKRGRNVLHLAMESKVKGAVKVILENPSLSYLINEKDIDGNTPLHQLAASTFFTTSLIWDHRVDFLAMNKDNQSALDVSLSVNDVTTTEGTSGFVWGLKVAGAHVNLRKAVINKNVIGQKPSEDKNSLVTEVKDAQQIHLVVATLIATVTFAAGLTLPGGYIEENGPHQGSAVLIKRAAFKAFVVSDTLAVLFSLASIFIHFFLVLLPKTATFLYNLSMALSLTLIAMVAMAVAFVTGLYAVLENSGLFVMLIWGCSCLCITANYIVKILRVRLHIDLVTAYVKKGARLFPMSRRLVRFM